MDTIIVGNSAALLEYGLGTYIDSFGTVVRFNRAVTKGYENQVGSKFDVWVTDKLYKNVTGMRLMYWMAITRNKNGADEFSAENNVELVKVRHSHKFLYVKKMFGKKDIKGLHLTTGIAFIVYVVDNNIWQCPMVVGFDGYSDDSDYTQYYSKNEKGNKYVPCNDLHCTILQKLHDEGKINWIKL